MTWKTIDDINIVCKKCDQAMVLESMLNNSNGIYVCNKCREHINLSSSGSQGVRVVSE